MAKFPCVICSIDVKYKAISCNLCQKWFHADCVNMTKETFKTLCKTQPHTWSCGKCEIDYNKGTEPKNENQIPPKINKDMISNQNENLNISNRKTSADNASRNSNCQSLNSTNDTDNSDHEDIEDVHTKIMKLKNQTGPDFETSLSLAEEFGNSLLQENSKQKEELQILTLENSKLALKVNDLSKRNENIYLNQIEQLETEKEALHNKNLHLIETVNDLEQQLDKERQLRRQLMTISEECDKEKEEIINKYEKIISTLQKDITELKKRSNNMMDEQSYEAETKKETETQTSNTETPTQNYNFFLIELSKMKLKQEEMEKNVNKIQEDIYKESSRLMENANHRSTPRQKIQTVSQSRYVRLTPFKKDAKKKNQFSVSLQVTKSKQDTLYRKNIHRLVQDRATNKKEKACVTNTFKVHKGPPCTAKLLPAGESFEEFFNKSINQLRTMPQCPQQTIRQHNMTKKTSIEEKTSNQDYFLESETQKENSS